MKIGLLLSWLLLSSSSISTIPVQAQLTCSVSAKDEPSCLTVLDDSGEHCVWCSLSRLGFCVAENQAKIMEKNLPTIHCDRYHGDKNDTTTDDATPTPPDDTDDKTPPDNTDDQAVVPDNYWTCLLLKSSKACEAEGCTWCDTKAGFSLCMTGPSAKSAAQSHWFNCHSHNSTNVTTTNYFGQDEEEEQVLQELELAEEVDKKDPQVQDPLDTSCLLAYLEDETETGCTSAVDQDGNPCEWCSLMGIANLCLNADQAAAASQIGVTCESPGPKPSAVPKPVLPVVKAMATTSTTTITTTTSAANDHHHHHVDGIYDITCALAYLKNPTDETCLEAKDQDGQACEVCTLQGLDSFKLCLTSEQAVAGQGAVGLTCTGTNETSSVIHLASHPLLRAKQHKLKKNKHDRQEDAASSSLRTGGNLYDPSCILAFISSQDKDTCVTTVDQEGASCEWCSYLGANICLNPTQGDFAVSLGISCAAAAVDAAGAAAAEVSVAQVQENHVAAG